ncbi:MAG: purine-nucleoside phosphorylase [Ignavibacteria bacterium]|nr:purine-nucleoside phosphorylase [Ignavibacteria bacterium]
MRKIENLFEQTISDIKSKTPFQPDIAIILGSGLGNFAKSVNTIFSIKTNDILNYPTSSVEGHAGKIHFAEYEGKKLILFQGRIHFYEGYSLSQCLLPVQIIKSLRCKNLIVTNAAGGINQYFIPGDLMLIKSFNASMIKKEIAQIVEPLSLVERENISNYPSKKIVDALLEASLEEKFHLKEGLYWISKGPSYETPAEVEMMRRLGADAVGMSTAHEILYATALGIQTVGVSCITNFAAGISKVKLAHADVTETATRVESMFEKFIKRTITLI